MIAIQLLLIFCIILVLGKFLASRDSLQTQAWKKIFLVILACAAIVFIVSPSITNKIAHILGVGRGADLLLYVLTVAFIFGQLNNYIKSKEEHKRIVILARKIAISEALHAHESRDNKR